MFSKSASIVRGLEPHYATLQCLGLSLEHLFNWYHHTDPDPASLRCFSALKQWKVSPTYIFGQNALHEPIPMYTEEMLWKTLPKTLGELWFTGAGFPHIAGDPYARFVPDCLLPALNLFIQNPRFYPLLTQFRLDFDYCLWDADWLNPLAMVYQSAEVRGINCTVILTGLYEGDLYEPYDGDNGDGDGTKTLSGHRVEDR
jgi:hypothetical protein